jgi:hypothetical protein
LLGCVRHADGGLLRLRLFLLRGRSGLL